ncbi:hypothetical protein [Limisalsivibrio acetivorans]|uniref:hypothetical protein n=1 Tax=Limisalsivibrio acetivorans TaxID=1304888 RepID=UPI0003B4FB27|nr:hypothetical protein [Limisalsivibrio acetivorans]
MKTFIKYDGNGKIEQIQTVTAKEASIYRRYLKGWLEVDGAINPKSYYIENGKLTEKPPRPSKEMSFDHAQKKWVVDKSLVRIDVNQNRNRKLRERVTIEGDTYDADDKALVMAMAKVHEVSFRSESGEDLHSDELCWIDGENRMKHFNSVSRYLVFLKKLIAEISRRNSEVIISAHKRKCGGENGELSVERIESK